MKYKNYDVVLKFAQYDNGRLAIRLFDPSEGLITTATTNLPEVSLGEDEVFIKDYTENVGVLSFLLDNGFVEQTGRTVRSGYVAIPIVKITPKLKSLISLEDY
jgi:hypothetical protein